MAYYYNQQPSGKPIVIRNSSGKDLGNVPSVVSTVYSYRTGRKPTGVLALGELRLNHNIGSVSDYLEAEQTAIRELNSELESSSVLGEGTWGSRDAGHVFSRVRQSRKGLHHRVTFADGRVHSSTSDGAWLSPTVDSITNSIMDPYLSTNYSAHHWMITSNAGAYNRQDTLRQASELLWQTSPDIIKGSIGQDLVDLAQLPKLLMHLKGLGSALDSLKSKWGRLDRDVQDAVDLLFKKVPQGAAQQRRLKRLRAMPKRSLSKASSAYLEWAFVLSPYIDDLQLMLRVLGQLSGATIATTRRSRTSREYRWADDYAGMVIMPYFNTSSPNVFMWWGGPGFPLDTPHCWRLIRYDISVHTKWAMKGATLNPFVQKAVDLNQQLGVIYPSLLWDLMPWTFLIDWYLHIGTSIDRVAALNKGQYAPVYAWATIKGSSGVGWTAPPSKFWESEILSCPWPGMPVTSWLTRFPVSLKGGLKPQWTGLPSSARGVLAALGFSRLK